MDAAGQAGGSFKDRLEYIPLLGLDYPDEILHPLFKQSRRIPRSITGIEPGHFKKSNHSVYDNIGSVASLKDLQPFLHARGNPDHFGRNFLTCIHFCHALKF